MLSTRGSLMPSWHTHSLFAAVMKLKEELLSSNVKWIPRHLNGPAHDLSVWALNCRYSSLLNLGEAPLHVAAKL